MAVKQTVCHVNNERYDNYRNYGKKEAPPDWENVIKGLTNSEKKKIKNSISGSPHTFLIPYCTFRATRRMERAEDFGKMVIIRSPQWLSTHYRLGYYEVLPG